MTEENHTSFTILCICAGVIFMEIRCRYLSKKNYRPGVGKLSLKTDTQLFYDKDKMSSAKKYTTGKGKTIYVKEDIQ